MCYCPPLCERVRVFNSIRFQKHPKIDNPDLKNIYSELLSILGHGNIAASLHPIHGTKKEDVIAEKFKHNFLHVKRNYHYYHCSLKGKNKTTKNIQMKDAKSGHS